MTLNSFESLVIIGVIALGTFITRALPFICFPNESKTPKYILYLGKVLPYPAIGLLIVYCLKNVSILQSPHGIPEGIAVLCVVLLHLWKENTFLSIGGGTLVYMLLLKLI
ncbi:MAG: branched-chain amino acid transporter AzlD [Clostridiaceae bacterium]|nr:branched-chain amino acid transporter AzlD [Clostridiaceae bacterium]